MIQLIIFLAVVAALLVLLVVAMRRQPTRAAGSAGELVTAKKTLESLQSGLLPPELVEQVFGQRDLAYVEKMGSKDIRDLFLSERERLALMWIRMVRRQVRALKEFHVSRSRMFTKMSWWKEFSLAVDFTVLRSDAGSCIFCCNGAGPTLHPILHAGPQPRQAECARPLINHWRF